ncbi:hypothetical protein J437_LFUL007326 [Ladona fulva]|uniref:Uncharacterized protein n=1 Tax=Ladona fulva TaxID=123851 RepID=A0A8K0P2R6_LADFU|nr:hypothetical protein J437_LFUL007326 [Ladona fulva]
MLERNPEGRRQRGRPRERWWNQVKTDSEKVGAAEEDAEDRSGRRGYVNATKYQLMMAVGMLGYMNKRTGSLKSGPKLSYAAERYKRLLIENHSPFPHRPKKVYSDLND